MRLKLKFRLYIKTVKSYDLLIFKLIMWVGGKPFKMFPGCNSFRDLEYFDGEVKILQYISSGLKRTFSWTGRNI